MTRTAKVFQSENSQAVRLPKDFRFDVDEVEISKEVDAVILRPRPEKKERWASLREALAVGFSDDFMANGREQPAFKSNRIVHNLENMQRAARTTGES